MNKAINIRVAGFGGQGVMLFGQLLSYSATDAELNTIWYPSYGPETRGGTANCSVVISPQTINSPVFKNADHLVVFNAPSLEKFIKDCQPGGLILYNSSIINAFAVPPHVTAVGVPINDIAAELGNARVINIVLLGAYIALTSLFTKDQIMDSIRHLFGTSKASLIPINEAALQRGIDYIREGGWQYVSSSL